MIRPSFPSVEAMTQQFDGLTVERFALLAALSGAFVQSIEY